MFRDAQDVLKVLRGQLRAVLVTFGLVIGATISYYVLLVYMPTFAKTQLKIGLGDAFTAQVIALSVLTVVIPLVGHLSDLVGRRPPMLVGNVLLFSSLYPLFQWLQGAGDVPRDDMWRTFNMGIGLIVVARVDDADALLASIRLNGGDGARVIGAVTEGAVAQVAYV